MPNSSVPAVSDVGDFYDKAGQFLQTLSGDNTHVGYWEDDSDLSSFPEAQDKLTDLLGAKLDLHPGQRLLDVGCGLGRPALRLAEHLDVDVTGIAVSPWQIGQATRGAEQHGGAGQATFQLADAMSLPFDDDSFDAALALEVLIHVPDVPLALREISRVLRPGGRLVMSDITGAKPMTAGQRKIFTSVMPFNWPVPSLQEYCSTLRAAGFEVVESIDVTDHVRRSYLEIPQGITARRDELVVACGQEVFDRLDQGIRSLTETIRECTGYLVLTCTA